MAQISPQPLERLLRCANATLQGRGDVAIAAIRMDSRLVSKGDLFVALAGKHFDGHHFINDAFERGAAAALGEKPFSPPCNKSYALTANSRQALAAVAGAFYGHPTSKLNTIGITGTKGKTTTAHLCAALLTPSRCLSTVTNAVLPRENTTPESLDVQRMAYESLQSGDQHLILEVSAHGLAHHRVSGLSLDAGVFTNLSQDHFDDFDGFDAYFAAKARLFLDLVPRRAILNIDDPYGRQLKKMCGGDVWAFGLNPGADFHAQILSNAIDHTLLNVHTPFGRAELALPLPGEFNVYNALAAVAVGCCARLPLENILNRLAAFRGVRGRVERFETPQNIDAVVDFAHSPDSLEKMLKFLNAHYEHVITVFGCGGESDALKRPIMGAISGTLSAHTVLTHDNPKSEDPMHILAQIQQGIEPVTNSFEMVPDRQQAITRAFEVARTGDCVLIAGKGHETTQIFADHVTPYNDSQFLLAELGATRAKTLVSVPQRLAG